ncbi:hypothetical protein CAPTEDRAFT_227379 [Capitella teleta]|uniref:Uncharacterized protein n=1 Tax=Capitella teleta TaxID=283909 RepID=R7UHJ7_CAPTE|nr:hypothetical protein CAPTEDRAFT_227379 [Capitella teleta]|eukprot:ELU03288.1 hypothetical protein CAPTEDRAFT_227379 [Capitella teleta]
MTSIEVEVTDLMLQKDTRRSIVNRELMVLYGYDVERMRRRGPRVLTFPGVLIPRPSTFRQRGENLHPHIYYEHIKMILNTKISSVNKQRPITSHGHIERMPYQKLGPVDNLEGLIVPRKLQTDFDNHDGVSDLASVFSFVGSGLRRPRLANMGNRRKKDRKGKGSSCVTSCHRKEDIVRVIKGDTENLPRPTPTKVKIYFCTPPMAEVTNNLCASGGKTVQPLTIFRWSLQGADKHMEMEKRYLSDHAFPELRHFCQRLGLDFQVIDIPIGTDLDNQTTFQYKMNQLKKCRDESIGPFFVMLIGDRYGTSLLPNSLTEKEFKAICKMAEEHLMDNMELISKCYHLDENGEPPTYKLQLAGLSQQEFFKLEKVAKDSIKLCVQMSLVPVELGDIVERSVMDHEVHESIPKSKGSSSQCLCFHRVYKGLIEHIKHKSMHKVLDLLRIKGVLKPMPDTKRQSHLKDLLTFISSHIGEENMKSYDVLWQGDGIEEDKYEAHSIYLRNLSRDFIQGVKRLVEYNWPQWEIKYKHMPLYKEVVHHARISSSFTKSSVGIEELMLRVCGHLKDKDKSCIPLVIHGAVGQGKSCFSASIKKQAKTILGEKSVSIIRFLGSSPHSTYLHELLQHICDQLAVVYNIDPLTAYDVENTDRLFHAFNNYLDIIAKHQATKRPLLIILDSLHELDHRYRAHTLFWLPAKLPPNIHIILSVDSTSDLLEKLTYKFGTPLELKSFDQVKGQELFNQIMCEQKKHLSQDQMSIISHTISSCHDPVFTQWLTLEVSQWTSGQDVSLDNLPSDMHEFMLKRFNALENEFGQNFTQSALYLLTALKHGISEVELRDTLSINEDVYHDVMKNAERDKSEHSSLRSYPQILDSEVNLFLHRVKDFLVSYRFHEKNLLRWKHELFKNIVKSSYFKEFEYENRQLEEFGRLNTVFAQEEGVTKTFNGCPVDCGVTPQFLFPNNVRKLHVFAEIADKSEPDEDVLTVVKSQLLCNFKWLLTKLEGTSFRALWADFKRIKNHDHEVDIMKQVIKGARHGLKGNSLNLPSQILGALPYLDFQQYPTIYDIIRDAENWVDQTVDPLLVPLIPCFPSAKDLCQSHLWSLCELIHLDQSVMGVVKNKDGLIEIWDMHSEDLAFSLGLQFDKSNPNICIGDTRVLGIDTNIMKIWEIESGQELLNVDVHDAFGFNVSTMFCLCHCDDLHLLAMYVSDNDFNQSVVVISTNKLELRTKISTFDVKDEFYFDAAAIVQNGQCLVFVSSRRELTDSESSADFIKLSFYDISDGSLKYTVHCGQKKINRIFVKDDDHIVLSWMDCSYDIYSAIDGSLVQHLSSPESHLILQSCQITPDGYLVILASTPLDQNTPHYGVWFWNLNDLVAAELFVQPLVSEEATPKYFVILEELKMIVIGIPVQGKISIWDLPTSTLVHTIPAHSAALNGIIKSNWDPYVVYTSSHAEKVVKMWNIHSVIHKATKPSDDEIDLINRDEEMTNHDGILRKIPRQTTKEISKSTKERSKSVRFADDIRENGDADHELVRAESANSNLQEAREDDSVFEADTYISYGSRDQKTMQAQASAIADATSFVLTKDGKYVICGSDKRPPVIWNCSNGTVLMKLKAHQGHEQATPLVKLALDDEVIVGFTRVDKEEEEGWRPLYKYKTWSRSNGHPLTQDGDETLFSCGEVSKDGSKIALVAPVVYDPLDPNNFSELQVKILDIKEGNILSYSSFKTTGIPISLELSDDLQYGVTLTPGKRPKLNTISVFSLEADKTKSQQPASYEYKVGAKYKLYGSTANCLLTNSLSIAVGLNGDLQMWDITSLKYEGNFFHDPGEKDTANPSLHNHGGRPLNHVIVSDDRRFMVCGGGDGVASVWDLGNEILLFNYNGHTAPISRVAISQDAQLVLTSGEDFVLNVWQFSVTDRPLCQLYIHVISTMLEISRDKQTVVTIGGHKGGSSRLQIFRLKNIREAS